MGLIKESVNSQLNEIVGKCFSINRMLDRDMSLLAVKFKMTRSAKLLHPILAHSIVGDKFADAVSEYQAKRDMLTIYPATQLGDQDYEFPIDLFKEYYNKLVELQSMVYDCEDTCVEVGDHTTRVFLDEFLEDLIPYVDLALNFVDILGQYGNEPYRWQRFDTSVEKYIEDFID